VIIPTADYDPLFAEDGIPFRIKMIRYIEREFADVLGPYTGLLRSDQGLEQLAKMDSGLCPVLDERGSA